MALRPLCAASPERPSPSLMRRAHGRGGPRPLARRRIHPSNGEYTPDLQIGHYKIKAEASGFKAAEQKDIVLTVGDRVRTDFQMQIGGATETVTVEAAAVRVQTDSGEQSNLISDQQVAQRVPVVHDHVISGSNDSIEIIPVLGKQDIESGVHLTEHPPYTRVGI